MEYYKKAKFSVSDISASLDGSPIFSTILIVLSVIFMAISVVRPSTFDPARTYISDIFAPALSVVSYPFYQASIFVQNISSLSQLQADKLSLEQENSRLREWYQTALLLDSENKSLRDLLNLEIDRKYDYISSRIISDSGHSYVKSLLILVGSNDGIEKGNTVLSGDGLVGRIIDVSKKTSRILLATDINLRVPVVVANTGQNAIMAGTNGKNPILIHLPQGSNISNGARLITSGYGGVYPHGIPVGRVIIGKNNIMEVNLFSDFDKIQIVRILQNSKSINKDN